MNAPHKPPSPPPTVKLAIVGGGRTCRFLQDLVKNRSFPFFDIEVVGVCDIDPEAEGIRSALALGIPTTDDYQTFFSIPDLDGIIELTNDSAVFAELVRKRPEKVGVLEHKIGKLLRDLFETNQRLKHAEQQVLLEKMSSDFLIQQSNAAIAVIDTDFTIVETNAAYREMVGKEKAELVGRHCYEVYYGLKAPCSVARPELACPMLETLRTGKSAHVIHEVPKRGNTATYGNIVTYPMKDREGRILRIIEIWRDITDLLSRRWDARMAELRADLNRMVQEDRLVSLGKLVASCVHEINNPLQGLLMFNGIICDMLEEAELTVEDRKKMRHFATLMDRELVRCGAIVSGLLSFAREAPSEYRELDLREVVEADISLTHHKMKLQGIHLEYRLPETVIPVRGDMHQLQQCVLNLIFNAMEAMPQGGRLSVALTKEEKERLARIEVSDTGTGIPADALDHVFDPFFTTKPAGEGTGLGLSIVYGVVKKHAGHIAVASTVGQGSSFSVTLPLFL